MEISIKAYGGTHSISFSDDSTCPQQVRAFLSVLLSSGFDEEQVIKAMLSIEDDSIELQPHNFSLV